MDDRMGSPVHFVVHADGWMTLKLEVTLPAKPALPLVLKLLELVDPNEPSTVGREQS